MRGPIIENIALIIPAMLQEESSISDQEQSSGVLYHYEEERYLEEPVRR